MYDGVPPHLFALLASRKKFWNFSFASAFILSFASVDVLSFFASTDASSFFAGSAAFAATLDFSLQKIKEKRPQFLKATVPHVRKRIVIKTWYGHVLDS